jgi:hypothetical protein
MDICFLNAIYRKLAPNVLRLIINKGFTLQKIVLIADKTYFCGSFQVLNKSLNNNKLFTYEQRKFFERFYRP